MSNNNQNRNSNASVKQLSSSQPVQQQPVTQQENLPELPRTQLVDSQAISDELAASRAEVAELKSLVQQIIARDMNRGDVAEQQIVAAQPLQPQLLQISDYERRRGDFRDAALRAERRAEEESDRQQNDKKLLQSGEVQFEISMFGEPRMTRTVGGGSEYEAEAKYKRYFNITGVQGGQARIIIKPLSPAVAV